MIAVLMPNEHFFSYVMARTSYMSINTVGYNIAYIKGVGMDVIVW